jgi:ribA/ribD-fused uncharacterized protein
MEDILVAKFEQNPAIAEVLLGTRDRPLVEAAEWDAIWGIGMCTEEAKRTPQEHWGRNLLGKALEGARRQLLARLAP